MEFLKEHLGEELYEQVVKALEGNEKVQLANLAEGGYVPQADLDALQATVDELQQQADDADPENLKGKIIRLEKEKEKEEAEQGFATQLAQIKLDSKLEARLAKEGAVNTKAVKALLDLDKINLEGDQLVGLDDQQAAIRKNDKWALPGAEVPGGGNPVGSGDNGKPDTLRDAVQAAYDKE
ncbi:MAG: phage scaffolding protein [Christensenellales bacterium]|jgi:hypothetical protein